MNGISKKEIEDKVNELNKQDNIAKINEEIKEIIKSLNNNFKADELNIGITEKDIDGDDDFLEQLDMKITAPSEDIKSLDPAFIIKMIYILQKEKKLIPPLSEETYKFLNYFKSRKETIQPQKDSSACG